MPASRPGSAPAWPRGPPAKRVGQGVTVPHRVYTKFIRDTDDAEHAEIAARLAAGAAT
ncbi:hypothetical protein [Streptomyces sp. NPDC127098]|uniref:hypothetical protein n=1 Tax=Streptomyces sp. NPDC127098 TaxID=3347137 RepID=UPI003653D07E